MHTYANFSKACLDCPPECETCTDYSTCTSCSTNYYLYSASCVLVCPTSYFNFYFYNYFILKIKVIMKM